MDLFGLAKLHRSDLEEENFTFFDRASEETTEDGLLTEMTVIVVENRVLACQLKKQDEIWVTSY